METSHKQALAEIRLELEGKVEAKTLQLSTLQTEIEDLQKRLRGLTMLAGDADVGIEPGRMSLTELRTAQHLPTFLYLPDGKSVKLHHWNDILVAVAKHLRDQGKLTSALCPVKTQRATKEFLVGTIPVHPSGIKFRSPVELGEKLWLEKHGGALELVVKTQQLIDFCRDSQGAYSFSESP